jgi:hypothetical protein
MTEDITHREIYDRLVAVEGKVDALTASTKDVTAAFAAALTVSRCRSGSRPPRSVRSSRAPARQRSALALPVVETARRIAGRA